MTTSVRFCLSYEAFKWDVIADKINITILFQQENVLLSIADKITITILFLQENVLLTRTLSMTLRL